MRVLNRGVVGGELKNHVKLKTETKKMNTNGIFFKILSIFFLVLGVLALATSFLAVIAVGWKCVRWALNF